MHPQLNALVGHERLSPRIGRDAKGRGKPVPCCLAGDVGALCGVEGFGNAVQVQAFLPDFLEEVCDKNGFGHTPSGALVQRAVERTTTVAHRQHSISRAHPLPH